MYVPNYQDNILQALFRLVVCPRQRKQQECCFFRLQVLQRNDITNHNSQSCGYLHKDDNTASDKE